MTDMLQVQVRTVAEIAPRVRSYELVPTSRTDNLPAFTSGAHITLHLSSGVKRQYSLHNDPADTDRYCIAVQREDSGRGGSLEIHRSLRIGSVVTVSPPRNLFPMNDSAENAILLAGGIGITPILSMARRLTRRRAAFQLIYLARDPGSAPFLPQLDEMKAAGADVVCHFDEGKSSNSIDVRRLFVSPRLGTHIYCCGPSGLMDAVRAATARWPQEAVHFEYFNNDVVESESDDRSFTLRLARSGRTIAVEAGQTILDALLSAGMDVDYSCEEGTCGTCVVPLIDGEVDHRDRILLPHEREAKIAICCSRAKYDLIAIDL